jgi:hypothetical protein
MMRTSDVKIKYPEQGATNPCGVFQQPVNAFSISSIESSAELLGGHINFGAGSKKYPR